MREAEGCDAYGNRIPSDLWNNRYDHRAAYKGDGGVRWEPRETDLKHIRDIWRDAFCAQSGLPPTTLSFSEFVSHVLTPDGKLKDLTRETDTREGGANREHRGS